MAAVAAPLNLVGGVLEKVGCAGLGLSPPALLQECQSVSRKGVPLPGDTLREAAVGPSLVDGEWKAAGRCKA